MDSDKSSPITNWWNVSKHTSALLDIAKRTQTRFVWIDEKKKNAETVAGIRDMTLRKGKGNAVIRADTGAKTGHDPHINFDPRGYPSRKNLHLFVPAWVISTVDEAQTAYENVISPALTTIHYGTMAYELVAAGWMDYDAYQAAIQAELENERELIDVLKFDDHAQEVYQEMLDEAKLVPTSWYETYVPENIIKSASSLAGGHIGSTIGGLGGAYAGTKTFSLIGGLVFGPPGALVGAVTGAIGGSIAVGSQAKAYGAQAGKDLAQKLIDSKTGVPEMAEPCLDYYWAHFERHELLLSN